MKREKLLIVTYGFNLRGILEPLRKIGFNYVVIVTGERNTQRKEFTNIIEFLPIKETITVDVFDFWSAYSGIVNAVRKYRGEERMDVEICASGGTNILTAGAIIASWYSKVKCYHVAHGDYSEIPYVPIEAVKITIDPGQMAIIKAIASDEMDVGQLQEICGLGADDLYDALLNMEREGHIYINREEEPKVRLTQKGQTLYDFMKIVGKIN